MGYQVEKKLVREYFDAFEKAGLEGINGIFNTYMADEYNWKGVYPFREQTSKEGAIEVFWKPFLRSVKHVQRRQDIFIAGNNEINPEEKWVMSMGHFVGLFDEEWMGIRPTGKMAHLRYAEFHCVEGGKITKTGLFIDMIGFMQQAGVNPMPPSTGEYFVYPGPRNHDGLLFNDADSNEGEKTKALMNKMVQDLSDLNDSGAMGCPPEVLEKSWSKNMIWYGPAGIGASYTIPRYQLQHQLPFRNNLDGKKFNGHVVRFAEGNFSCFFGWPNLTNRALGGFLGMTGGNTEAHMQVVDVYCRDKDKLSENWVLIDLPYWLQQQGLDIFERTASIMNPKF